MYTIYQLFLANIYLHILQNGNTEIVELLLKTPGIDVNASDQRGQTPLFWAAVVSYNHIEHL